MVAFVVLWAVTAWRISASYATQFLVGLANPFCPPVPLQAGQKALAISLCLAGWVLVPAVVGAMAALVATVQLERIFGADPRRRLQDGERGE